MKTDKDNNVLYTILGVVELLKKNNGYQEHKQADEPQYKYKTLLQKRIESDAVCELNDRLSINIWVSQIQLRDRIHESYDVEIVAEKNSKWWKLSCYSMNREEILKDLEDVENTLVRLFNYA